MVVPLNENHIPHTSLHVLHDLETDKRENVRDELAHAVVEGPSSTGWAQDDSGHHRRKSLVFSPGKAMSARDTIFILIFYPVLEHENLHIRHF